MQLPGEFSPLIKKVIFCLVVGGLTPPPPPPTPLVVQPLKKNTFFLCVSSLNIKTFHIKRALNEKKNHVLAKEDNANKENLKLKLNLA